MLRRADDLAIRKLGNLPIVQHQDIVGGVAHVHGQRCVHVQMTIFSLDRNIVFRLEQIQHHLEILFARMHGEHLSGIQREDRSAFLVDLIFHVVGFHLRTADDR